MRGHKNTKKSLLIKPTILLTSAALAITSLSPIQAKPAHAKTVSRKLAWDYDDHENIEGFIIFKQKGDQGTPISKFKDADNCESNYECDCTKELELETGEKYKFWLKAKYNYGPISEPSETITYTPLAEDEKKPSLKINSNQKENKVHFNGTVEDNGYCTLSLNGEEISNGQGEKNYQATLPLKEKEPTTANFTAEDIYGNTIKRSILFDNIKPKINATTKINKTAREAEITLNTFDHTNYEVRENGALIIESKGKNQVILNKKIPLDGFLSLPVSATDIQGNKNNKEIVINQAPFYTPRASSLSDKKGDASYIENGYNSDGERELILHYDNKTSPKSTASFSFNWAHTANEKKILEFITQNPGNEKDLTISIPAQEGTHAEYKTSLEANNKEKKIIPIKRPSNMKRAPDALEDKITFNIRNTTNSGKVKISNLDIREGGKIISGSFKNQKSPEGTEKKTKHTSDADNYSKNTSSVSTVPYKVKNNDSIKISFYIPEEQYKQFKENSITVTLQKGEKYVSYGISKPKIQPGYNEFNIDPTYFTSTNIAGDITGHEFYSGSIKINKKENNDLPYSTIEDLLIEFGENNGESLEKASPSSSLLQPSAIYAGKFRKTEQSNYQKTTLTTYNATGTNPNSTDQTGNTTGTQNSNNSLQNPQEKKTGTGGGCIYQPQSNGSLGFLLSLGAIGIARWYTSRRQKQEDL